MLTEEDRRRAAEMTEDPMVQDVDDVADVLRRHVAHIAELEVEIRHTNANLQIVGKDGDGTELLLISAQHRIADFEGRLGADEKPDEHALVEVYCPTQCSFMEMRQWSGWPDYDVQDWHLWRPRFKPDSAVLQRSAEIRKQLGVVELEGNGFYMLPEKDGSKT